MFKTLYHRAAFLAALLISSAALALPITKTVSINVWDVCNDSGTNCASQGPAGNLYFQNEVNKIWAQAGISVTFNFAGYINSTFYSNIDDRTVNKTSRVSTDHSLYALFGATGSVNFTNSSAVGNRAVASTTIENMYLVHTIYGSYGESWLGLGGMAIAMDSVMAYNGGNGRIDTIAHELGHNLGLVATPTGATYPGHDSVPADLMADGSVRAVPTSISQIGNGYDLIPTNDQYGINEVAVARSSTLLRDVVQVPEPTILLLLGSGFLGLIVTRRRA